VDEVISELSLALTECRAHIEARINAGQTPEYFQAAATKIEHALQLLEAIK
jgi:hypothetical protein